VNKFNLSNLEFIQNIQIASDYYEGLSLSETSDLIISFKANHPETKVTRAALVGFIFIHTGVNNG